MTEDPIRILVDEETAGMRLDACLGFCVEEASRSFLTRLITGGAVTVNGAPCLSKKEKVRAGDELLLVLPEPAVLDVTPQDIALDIVYEDESLLVVNKPKGMVVHPATGNYDGTLVNAVLFHCGDSLSGVNGVLRPGIVHRIDKDTSGLLVVAKNDKAHNSLAAQFAVHSITRSYRAIVYHNLKMEEGTVDAPIGRDPKNRLRQAVVSGGRNAVTHYCVLERFGKFTYIEARLETGRTHQIRVHMAYMGHPLLGDKLYGPKRELYGASSQVLHAKTLGFVHPQSGRYMEFDSPLPADFQRILDQLRSAGR